MTDRARPSRTAGIFDIRNIIGTLIGVYGVVLVIAGLVGTSAADKHKAAGVNANLWAGIVMLLVAAFFLVWAQLRPTVVDDVDRDAGLDAPAAPEDR
jgi:glucose uptake protein GlcU